MLSFSVILLLFLSINLNESKGNKGKDDSDDIAAKLSYPLTDVDPDIIKAYGESVNDGFINFINGETSFGEMRRAINRQHYKEGQSKVIFIVDGVEYKSLGQMTRYMVSLRNLFKTGSCKKSDDVEVETTVIDANTLAIYRCHDMVIDLDIGIYDASKSVHGCATMIYTFDNDMDLLKAEIISDSGFAKSAFQYILHSTMTTILPEEAYFIDNEHGDDYEERLNVEKKLLANPIFVVAMLMIVCMTLFIGLCIGLAINLTTNSRLSAKKIVHV